MNSYLESGFYIINSNYELVTFNHILAQRYPEMKKGAYCYKVLNGTSSPCEYCSIYNQSSRNQIVFYSEKQGHWISASFVKLDNSDKIMVITTSATDEMREAEEKHRSELEQINKELRRTLNMNRIFLNSMPPDFVACAIVNLMDGSQKRLLRHGAEITEVEVPLLWDDFLRDVINAHMTEPEQIENMQKTARLCMLREHKPGDVVRYDYFTSYQSVDGTPKPVSTILTFFEQAGLPYMNIFTTGNVKVEYEKKLKEEVEHLRQQDIKRRAELEKALLMANKANEAKSEFLSNMSHDIRTPMNAIVGITNLMSHEKDLTKRLRIYLQKIQFSANHLLGLINDVLDMSKIEANEISLNMEPIELSVQIKQIDTIIRARTLEKEQIFYTRFHKIWHNHLLGDGLRIRQILINLLSNAVKYTPNEGHITFEIEELLCKREDFAKFRFTVTDDGCGMSQKFLKSIFDPFVRSEASVTNKVQGTGLGMAISKNIIDLMGGEIQIDSTLGEGTCITVELDLKIDTSVINQNDISNSFVTDEKETDEKASRLDGMHFLCAEDNVLNAEILEALLELKGATCKIYSDGVELVEAFRGIALGEYDAILMDIQMPNMNGLEAARTIRMGENPLGKTIPIIAMTANAFVEDIQQSLGAGMNAHISKPIDIVLLEKTILSFCDKKKKVSSSESDKNFFEIAKGSDL